jgi:transposase
VKSRAPNSIEEKLRLLFALLPKRWIVERTIAWLNRCRRLAKDWENLNRKGLAFLRLASIRLMLRKLCNPP